MKSRFLLAIAATLAMMTAAIPQSNMRYATGQTAGTQTKVTIAVTNTYQQVFTAKTSRKGCLIQNNSANSMYVYFGAAAPADNTTSWVVSGSGGTINCTAGAVFVNQRAVWITGTAADVAVVDELL